MKTPFNVSLEKINLNIKQNSASKLDLGSFNPFPTRVGNLNKENSVPKLNLESFSLYSTRVGI
jgi:transcription antitermination factor NusG